MVPVVLPFYYTDHKTVKERSIYRSRVCINTKEHENVMGSQAYYWAPMGFGDLGRMAIYFQGAGEQAHSFGDFGSPAKSKKFNLNNLTLKEKPSFRLIFFFKNRLLGGSPPDPLGKSQCIYFRVNMLIRFG